MASAIRIASTGMLKVSPQETWWRARSMKASRSRPSWATDSEKYLSISHKGNSSFPAGTGVWVVKTVLLRISSTACVEGLPPVHIFPGALQAQEGGVAFVHMPDIRIVAELFAVPAHRRSRG